ncbi:hypothetical protein ACIRF8_01600 [Streptomyces sp. NPDC102406]|uniref:hypothetical protein n=1 Tax=Streptomyces sp. NPDC102406 TaxID=3366171 RepID=UPI0038046B4E
MESKLRQKLRERRDQVALEAIEADLGVLGTGGALPPGGEPGWVRAAIDRSLSTGTEPDELLADDTPPEELDAWIEGLLATHGMTGKLYVASHVVLRPWLECDVPATGWAARLRDAIEDPWMFLAGPLDRLVVVTEAEYCFECHVSRASGP